MATSKKRKRLTYIFAIGIGLLLCAFTIFHFWFKAHAKKMIENIVETKSHGKLKMKVGKFKFGYFSKDMVLENVSFFNTDTSTANTNYRFDVKKIKLHVKGLFAIVFKNQFLIDTLTLFEPDIYATRQKKIIRKDSVQRDEVSIPEEMGKIYKSIQDALIVLKVSKFSIINGRFTLINNIQPNQQPVTFSNLDFHMDNLVIDTSQNDNKNKILFSDNVAISAHDQDIVLPDNRHRLIFKNFRINLNRKFVEFDSCTIAATRTENTTSAFNVFFDKIFMSNIDFDTLYKAEVIKADSVYCVNPVFNLNVEIQKKQGKEDAPPVLENIIKQLTGDLLLNNVVVENADFNIITIKDKKPSSFRFSNNNFEMNGLKVNQDAKKPIEVDRFAMAIRHYENFIKDSSYSIKFDSILFRDDRISLSNFLFKKLEHGKTVNTFSIPQFFLGGLSWDALVFEKKLKADQATMFYPTIHYSVNPKFRKKGKQNIFHALGAVNDFMDLKYLEVVDGDINLTIKKDLQLQLRKANLSIQSNSFLSSKEISGLKNSLNSINFEYARLISGALHIDMYNLRYIGNSGHFVADSISVFNQQKKQLYFENIAVDKMIVDEYTGNIDAAGISWKKGFVDISLPDNKNALIQSILHLKNINGSNTILHIQKGPIQLSAQVDQVRLDQFLQKTGEQIQLDNLRLQGKNFLARNNKQSFRVEEYTFNDKDVSRFLNSTIQIQTPAIGFNIKAPSLSFIANISDLNDNRWLLKNTTLSNPVIDIRLDSSGNNSLALPTANLNWLSVIQPQIHIAFNNKKNTSFNWKNQSNTPGNLMLKDIRINQQEAGKISIAEVQSHLSDFSLSSDHSNYIANKATFTPTIKDIVFRKNADNSFSWQGLLSRLLIKDFQHNLFIKNEGVLKINTAQVRNVSLNPALLEEYKTIFIANPNLLVENFTGEYQDKENKLQWENFQYSQNAKQLTLDTFSLNPIESRDVFLSHQAFQKDYINYSAGKIVVDNFSLQQLFQDSIIRADHILITNPTFTDYKDQKLTFNANQKKPLPVSLLLQSPYRIAIDSLTAKNGFVLYTETVPNTNDAGVIPVSDISLRIKNIKNFGFTSTDSLDMQATGSILQKVLAQLHVKESYTDAVNNGFTLEFQLAPAQLSLVNTVLVPMASTKILSGTLSTFATKAKSRNGLATGNVAMKYHDLKVQFIDRETGKVKKLKTFLANSFLIKKKNEKRPGLIFSKRIPGRSVFNHYIKMIGSGIGSSIGILKNKKAMRKYYKKLNKTEKKNQ